MSIDLHAAKTAAELIDKYALDLSGLTVFTEAASGAYLYTPVVAALAGAARVYALTADSPYGPRDEIRERTLEAAAGCGVEARIEVLFDKRPDALAGSDIVTNSGFVRPIDRATVELLRTTAVIPLMWETWELRPEDLDLDACREHDILVLGTNESDPPCDMAGYTGLMALRLLFELGLEGVGTRTLLLGGQRSLAGAIHSALTDVGGSVDWFGRDPAPHPYERLPDRFARDGARYDALLVAEHHDPVLLLGEGGLLELRELEERNPALRIGVVAGNVDADGLRRSGLRHLPEDIRPFGWMSYQPSVLGPRPVLDLYTAGLKVGEEMARARLAGASSREAAARALMNSPAMDFEGTLAWA